MKHTDYLSKLEENVEYQAGLTDLKTHFALADAILRARLKRNLSQADLAEKVGTKQANISRLESGLGNPTLKLINKILQVLELDIKFVSSISTNSFKSFPFSTGIKVDNWPTKIKSNSTSSQSVGKLP